jgi:Xaa-Pro aminopeptidase
MDSKDVALIRAKQRQLDQILAGIDVDLWLVFCREGSDPSTLLYVGHEMVGETAFLFAKDGRKIAIVADFDRMAIESIGIFDEVVSYSQGIEEPLRKAFADVSPRRIALDYSLRDHLADGLSHGQFLRLCEILGEEAIIGRHISAETILAPLRARKTAEEIERIRKAVEITDRIFLDIAAFARPGMTEREVNAFIQLRQKAYGVAPAWGDGAAVCTGRIGVGHRSPGDFPLVPGDVFIVDMGVYYQGYCSDLTRTFYILREGETGPSPEFVRRFNLARDAITLAAQAIRPGKRGHEIDAVARSYHQANGLVPYTSSLGHQIGRTVHDGGGSLAPLNPRYGTKGMAILEEGNVFTLEPFVSGRTEDGGAPPIGLEEDALVTRQGCEFLSTRQTELVCVGGGRS